MVKRFFLGLVVMIVSIQTADAFVPTRSVELYYKGKYQEAIDSLSQSRNDNSKILLAKSYYALEKNSEAYAIANQVKKNHKVSSTSTQYVDYLSVVSSPDPSSKMSHIGQTPQGWLAWPKAFRNRARWIIATDCLRKKKSRPAESLLLSLGDEGYAPKDVRTCLVQVAVLEKNQKKAMIYYKELLTEYPDADSSRTLFGDIQNLSPTQVPFSWDIVFPSGPALYEVMKTARNRNLTTIVLDIGTVLINQYNFNDLDFLLIMAQTSFDKKLYDKAFFYIQFLVFPGPDVQIQERARFLKAQCFQKTGDFEKSILEYQNFISDFRKSKLLPEVYFNLYWVYRGANRSSEFQTYFKSMKQTCTKSGFFDKVCWELGWEAYLKDQFDEAGLYFQIIPGNLDDEFKSKVLYWSAKCCEKKDPGLADKLREFCISKYAFTYYGTRLLINSPPPVMSHYIRAVQITNIPKDKIYLMLFEEGLGEWAAQLLEEDLAIKKSGLNHEKYYTLATLYERMYQPNKAIRVLRKIGITFSPQNKPFSRELAEMLYPRPYWEVIQRESKLYGLDPYFVLSLMRAESEFNPDARSKSGALGLMQLMPATAKGVAKTLKVEWRGEDMMYEPEMNIKFGTYYISHMQDRFNGNWVYMLSGYNAGPNITKKWVDDPSMNSDDIEKFIVNIPYSETHQYVMRILKNYWIYKLLYEQGDQSRYAQTTSY